MVIFVLVHPDTGVICPVDAVVDLINPHTFTYVLAEPCSDVKWMFNGRPVQKSTRIKTSSSGTEHKLSITKCFKVDEGEYSIVVDGETLSSSRLTVKCKYHSSSQNLLLNLTN